MTENPKPTPTAITDDETAESRMRLALGLRGPASSAGHAPQQRADQARARHKFVQDGGVPVVMLNRGHDQDALAQLKSRMADVERQLEHERTAHAATRRQMQEAQAALQHEKTRFVHAELAHADALIAATGALDAAIAARSEDAATAAQALEAALAARRPARLALPTTEADPKPKRGRPPRKPAIDRSPIERPGTIERPVRWWTPSYRAKKA